MPDLIDQILARMVSKEPGARIKQMLQTEARKRERLLDKRAELLAQPDLLEKRVAAHAGVFSLSVRKARARRGEGKLEALERLDGGTSQEGFASELLGEYTAALEDPSYLGLSNRQLLAEVSKDLLVRQPEGEGSSRLEQAYRYKWQADTSIGNLLGVFGEDEDVKALPGYEEWLAREKEKPVESEYMHPATSAAIGSGFTAALIAGKRFLGKAGMWAPHPVAKVAGAALMMVPEMAVWDFMVNILHKSEWGRARVGTWRRAGADLLAGGVAIGAGHKVVKTALRKAAEKGMLSEGAKNVFRHLPLAENAIRLGEANKAARIARDQVDVAMEVNIKPEDVLRSLEGIIPGERARLGEIARLTDVLRKRGRALREEGLPAWMVESGILTKRARGLERRIPVRGELARPVILEARAPLQERVMEAARIRVGGTAAERLAQDILEVQTPLKTMGIREAGKAFGKLSEEGAERAIKKARTKGVRTAVSEEAKLAELEKRMSGVEKEFADKLESIKLAKAEGRVDKLEEAYEKLAKPEPVAPKVERATQRKKLKAQEKVQEELIGVKAEAPVLAKSLAEIKKGELIRVSDQLLKYDGIEKMAPTAPTRYQFTPQEGPLTGITFAVRELSEKQVVSKLAEKAKLFGIKVPVEKAITKADRLKLIEERGAVKKKAPKVTKVPPEATGLTEESKVAVKAVEEGVDKTIGLADEAGLEELLYGGGAEEGFVEGVKKGGKDLVDLFGDSGKLFGIGAIGLVGSVAVALGWPKEAEAGPVPQALKATGATISKLIAKTAEGSTEKRYWSYVKEWLDGKLMHVDIPEGAKSVEYFQESFRLAPWAAEEHGSLVKNLTGKHISKFLAKYSSPYWPGSELYKVSPTPEVGNVMSVIGNNAKNSLRAVLNIFDDVPGLKKGANKTSKEIIDAMAPLAERYSAEVPAYRALRYEMDKLGSIYDKLYIALGGKKGAVLKKTERGRVAELLGVKEARLKGRLKEAEHVRALEEIEKKMASWEVAEEELKPVFEAFEKEWVATVEPLARKHSTTRIALAVEDTADYDMFPFLRGILSPEEKEAVTWLKGFHETYKGRLLESGHDVIAVPYIHHAWHPKWVEKAAAERIEGFGLNANSVPYSKFFHRARYSKQMVPDVNYIMPKYIMDAERRIQWSGFWGKGLKNSWYAHRRWVYQHGSDDLQAFWRKLTDATIPPAPTKANQVANIYTSFEVARLLAGSGSVPLKHYFKVIGTMSTIGPIHFASSYFPSMLQAIRSSKNVPEIISLARKVGIKIPETSQGRKKLVNEVINSFITQQHTMNTVADLDFESLIPHKAGFWQAATKKLQTFNRWGSIPVRAIEALDRHHTVIAGWSMAAKKGMTAQQALYSIYGNILKVNFLSGAGNPAWIRNPKIRAMLLFQNTVFKIMERRLWTAYRAGRDAKTVIGVIRHQDIKKTLGEMKEIGKSIFSGEKELKQNMIFDAMTASRDEFGSSAARQTMREVLINAGVLMGGSAVGLNLMPQVWHIPLLRHGAKAPTLAVNPFINAAFKTAGEREMAAEYDEDQKFIMTQFLKQWMRSTGYLPQVVNKLIRISKNDIPEIYRGSKWQYFFSVPERGEHY